MAQLLHLSIFLAEDLDMRAMLPSRAVSEGDSWSLGWDEMSTIVFPGIDVAAAMESGGDWLDDAPPGFADEIEKILDLIIPQHVEADRLVELWASEITESFDWAGLLERLCGPEAEVEPEPQPVSYTPTLWD